ncbi:hypothetical protein KIW84_033575 [Lathyrus oleraceus]|uniref:Uncharacterized protein n=1 Tax=Pisum sativum TaxID=3888 RepID=A0A9D4XXY9_PEA|nr:hypothetical protein KIW84_033575 [Pisum sativum]
MCDSIKCNAESNAAHANLIASVILKTKDSGSTGCAGTFGHHSRSKRKYFMKNLDKTFDSKALYDTFSTITHPVFCKMATVGSGQSKERKGLTWDPIMRVAFNVRHNGFSKDESSVSADNSEFLSMQVGSVNGILPKSRAYMSAGYASRVPSRINQQSPAEQNGRLADDEDVPSAPPFCGSTPEIRPTNE